jgi:LppP/LprE lipoprotein
LTPSRWQTRAVCTGLAVLVICGCSSGGSSKSGAPATTSAPVTSTSVPAATTAVAATTNPPVTTASTSAPTTIAAPQATTPPTTPPPPDPATATAVSSAVQLVRARGFTPDDTNDFTGAPVAGFHVIIGTATGSADGYAKRAFFFVDGRFVATDPEGPSAGIQLAWRNDKVIALAYATYKAGEPMCCPTGGAMIVRYEWTGKRLKALDPIPPGTARR